ncbi:toll/interleukin-1 receptor domain-containing protein, partial [Azospirillum sp.]|uniref:toll/interleukin-1 receptor domain-containing protein n=1 Tax=Azospirillum sp. TaxID=34012 RepID=UPI0026169F8D
MARIFLSHSNRDNDEAAGLKSWLAARDFPTVFLDSDKDTGIQPGAGWEKTLYRELDRAQAVLLVVTDHWLNSKWCFAEFAQARALGKDIIPLIVGPTLEKLVGEDLQAIDLLADRQDGLERLERRLRGITQQSPDGFELGRGVAPFPGLAAFEEDQAAVFFGRDPDIRKMLERLRLRHIRGGEKLILLLGASGSGKSSLLRAGLIPRLKRDRGNWIALPPFRPGRTPRAQLVDCLLAGVGAVGLPQLAAWRDALEGDAPDAALTAVARTLRQQNAAPDANLLLPIDQAEELFTLAMAAERADFLALLSRLLDESLPFVAVATLRADHLSGLQSESALTASIDLQPLDAMPLDRIAALVRGPARLVGLRVDDGLITALTRDAERPDALPLVAVALNELHARFGPDGALTLAGYESLGARDAGISPLDAVVRERAETALGAAPATAAAAEKEEDRALRDAFVPWLVRLQEETGQFIRQAAALDRFPALARTQLERLVEARLLVRRGGRTPADPAMLEVTHEALFRVWPRLAGWLEQERDFLIARNRIEQAFHDWRKLSGGGTDSGLLSGAILDQARQGLAAHPTRFDEEESEYIRRSDAMARAEAARKRRMRRSLFAALLAALVILAVGAGTSFYLYRQQRAATARAEAALATATDTANGLVFDLVQKFKQSGLSNAIAREILQRAADLQDRLAQGNEGNIDLLHSRAAMLDERAQSLADFGDPGGAATAAEASLTILRTLAGREPDNSGFQRDLSVSLDRVADIRRRSDPAGALALYDESLGIARRLAQREPDNSEFQRNLSANLDRIADIRLRSDPAGALVLYDESLGIARRLAQREPDNSGFQRDLSVSLEKIADIRLRSDPAGALALYDESLGIRRRLAQREPDNRGFQRDLSVSLNNIADIRRRSDPAGALALYDESLGIAR